MRIDFVQVAEITNSSSTVGVADSSLVYMSQADINKTLDEMQAIGVTNVRVLVPWATIETSDNVYNWKQMDMVMSAAAARNMGVMADINSTPLWAAPPNTYPGAGTPPVAQFASFVQQVATKYGSTISAYEIWNEPNYKLFYDPIDPVSYTALLAAAYPVIKSIDPTATVVAGALGAGSTTGLTLNPVDFVNAMIKAGAGNYFDALSFHPYQESLKFSAGYTYPGLGTPLEQLDAIKTLIGTGKSVWISEYGLPTSDVSQQQQSDYIKDLLDYWQGYSQAGPVFLYTTRDGTAAGSSLTENTYGLYNADGTPKLAAQMLQAWIKAHPQTTAQANPIVALLQVIGQQIAQAIGQLVSLGQSIITAITNFVSSIAAAFAGLVTPLTTVTPVAPLTLRTAPVESMETANLVESTASAADPVVDQSATSDATAVTGSKPTLSAAAEGLDISSAVVDVAPATPVEVVNVVISEPLVTKPVAVETSAVEASTVAISAVTAENESTATATTSATTNGSRAPAVTTDTDGPVTSVPGDADGSSSAKPTKRGSDKSGSDKSGSDKSGGDKEGAGTSSRDEASADAPSRPRKVGERRHQRAATGGSPSAGAHSGAADANSGGSAS